MSEFLGSISGRIKKASPYEDEQPLSAEIFSVERLEQYAKVLAREHKTIQKKGRAQLLPRVEDNGRKLVAAYRSLVEAIRTGRGISPAAGTSEPTASVIVDDSLSKLASATRSAIAIV